MLLTLFPAAMQDIYRASKHYSLIGMLGWQDVRQRYRRSVLGPFWLSISMSIMIGIMWVVFGQIYHTPMKEFLPYLATGMIFWNFISLVLTEGCLSFIAAETIIKQLPIPLFVHVSRLLWRNLLILAHNFVIFPLVLIAIGKPLQWEVLLSIPGFLLLLLNLTWAVLLLGTLSARYRDLPQIVTSGLQIFFYLTPIMWMPSFITNKVGAWVLQLNPVYHCLAVVRMPLLSQLPSSENWIVASVIAVLGWGFTLTLYNRYKRRIVYWL